MLSDDRDCRPLARYRPPHLEGAAAPLPAEHQPARAAAAAAVEAGAGAAGSRLSGPAAGYSAPVHPAAPEVSEGRTWNM